MKKPFVAALLFAALLSPRSAPAQSQIKYKISHEKYTLANGLTVILHIDHSDPMVAVNILYHVGASREEKGKTGLAHLFEHLMFSETQFSGPGEYIKTLSGLGGSCNASTGMDKSMYYEVLPKNGLETALWLESNRMGWLLGKLSQESFAVQQHVVQNEKRQYFDNVPYGQRGLALNLLMYPEGHPYRRTTIGSLEDLRNAKLQDVIDFHAQWYAPDNATLVIAGDIDAAKTKGLIDKYFGEIAAHGHIPGIRKMPVRLAENKRGYYEDPLANAPYLTMSFPAVETYSPDANALLLLSLLLGGGPQSPLSKVVVEERKLAASVSAYSDNMELAGTFAIYARAFPGQNLGDLKSAFGEALSRFEKDGFAAEDLARLKSGQEAFHYNSIQSVLRKSIFLADYNTLKGSPDFMDQHIHNYLNVSPEDIWRVYNQYVRGKNHVLLSIVPTGQAALAAPDSKLIVLPQEAIADQSVIEKKDAKAADFAKPSRIDRSQQPPVDADPVVHLPQIWTGQTDNGIKIFGLRYGELPLVQFTILLNGGMLLDPKDKIGVANLTARLMNEGTRSQAPGEWRNTMKDAGANISIIADSSNIVVTGSCLVGKLRTTLGLLKEMLLEPRWDDREFAAIKILTIESLKRSANNPADVAASVFSKLIYGPDNILSFSPAGSSESIKAIIIDDLKTYYERYFSPSRAKIAVVGDISREDAVGAFNALKEWRGGEFQVPAEFDIRTSPPGLYFVDMPNAKQSVIRVGHLSMPATAPDYGKMQMINYGLGGDFNSILNTILREQKAYAFSASSGFSGSNYPGVFMVSTAVQSNATSESVQIIKDEVATYGDGISSQEIGLIQKALLRKDALKYETMSALADMLRPIIEYDYDFDYTKKAQQDVLRMTPREFQALTHQYIEPRKLIYLVVGDKATQWDRLRDLGLGDPILLDREGNRAAK